MSVSKGVSDVQPAVGSEYSIFTFQDDVFMEHHCWRRKMGIANQCIGEHWVVTAGNWIFLETISDWIFMIIFQPSQVLK
jgi:hypothetical protein